MAKPCPDKSSFQCITLSVPRDHFTAGGPSWDVTFAIQRAANKKLGTWVTITGGPGSSGIASADSYTSGFAAGITDNYDIVFIDQRGVGQSKPIDCPIATEVYYQTDADPGDPTQVDAAAKNAKTYVADCMGESKADPADLPFYSTRQAVEDLESIRQYLGADKLDLYGESYGTQYVQTYASAHPDRVAALFVDGPVDLTQDGPAFYKDEVRAFDDALSASLTACDTDTACRRDTAGPGALAGYDTLRAKLATGPISYQWPTARGTFETRQFTSALFETAAVGYVYSQYSRMLLQRAVAAATRGDLVPLAHLAYDELGVDPETLKPIPYSDYSDAMYYAVECQDYAFYLGAGDETARLKAWIADATSAGVEKLRLGTTFYGDLPCLWWPAQPKTDGRVPALTTTSFPVFVLTATLDPATPFVDAMRIYGRASDPYMFVQVGGPHVIFGRGLDCPDVAVTDYLAKGTLPSTRITVCDGAVADPYVANPKPAAKDYRTALQFMSAMDDQINNTDDYNYRFDTDPIALGCDAGGSLTYRPASAGTAISLLRCAFTKGLAMTGSGLINDDGSFRLTATLVGGTLRYTRDVNGKRSVSGTFRGAAAH